MADQRPGDKGFGESVPDQGATGIFGFVESEAKEAAKPPISQAPGLPSAREVPAVTPASSEGTGFTQLLRALANEPVAQPAAASALGLTSRPVNAVPPTPALKGPSTGGFTEIFGTLEESEKGDSGTIAKPTGPPPVVGDGFTKAFGAQGSDSGSFTAALPVFSSPAVSGRPPSVEPTTVSAGDVPAPAAYVPRPVAETPVAVGEFTRLFQTLDSKTPEAAPVFSSPIAPPVISASPATSTPTVGADSGGFTQLLRAFESTRSPLSSAAQEVAARPPAVVPQAAAVPHVCPPPASTGSFTQLFQALGPASTASPGPGASTPMTTTPQAGDGFTQSFSGLGTSAARSTSQADSFPPIAPSRESAPVYPAPEPSVQASAPRYPDPVYTAPSPTGNPSSAGGSLEEILRALEGPSKTHGRPAAQPISDAQRDESLAAPGHYPAPVWREPAPPPQSVPQHQYAYPDPEAGTAPKAQSAPGGMTSIINASEIREMERVARQGGAPATPAGPAVTPSPAAPALAVPPLQYPTVPGYPSIPSYPSAPNPAQAGGWPMQSNPMQVPSPQIPQMSPPAIPAPAVPQAGGAAKAWLPILLIVIIVLLVGILLAVLLMKK